MKEVELMATEILMATLQSMVCIIRVSPYMIHFVCVFIYYSFASCDSKRCCSYTYVRDVDYHKYWLCVIYLKI